VKLNPSTACAAWLRQSEGGLFDQGYTGSQPSQEAAKQGVTLEMVKLSEARKGFVLLPKRWVVERPSARFRRLSRDFRRLPDTLAGLHWLVSSSSCSTASFKVHDMLKLKPSAEKRALPAHGCCLSIAFGLEF
jgi:transposase